MRALREFCVSSHIVGLWDAPLSLYSSFRIGGRADALLFPANEEELSRLLVFLSNEKICFRVIGNATNLLFSDEGYRGALVTTRHMRSLSQDGNGVRSAAGVSLNDLIRFSSERGLCGMEALYGIPGTVGGALYMNAGAFGAEISSFLSFVNVWDKSVLQMRVLKSESCGFGYRESAFSAKGDWVILSATFHLERGTREKSRALMHEFLKKRQERQPLAFPSAGSVFRRPEGHYVGALVERAGLLGKRIGNAAVSEKHGGFIVNLGGATAKDVLALVALIKKEIYERFGVALSLEIEYIE